MGALGRVAADSNEKPHSAGAVVSIAKSGWPWGARHLGVAGAQAGTIGNKQFCCGGPGTSITAGPGMGRRLQPVVSFKILGRSGVIRTLDAKASLKAGAEIKGISSHHFRSGIALAVEAFLPLAHHPLPAFC